MSETCHIKTFFHCTSCLGDKPEGVSLAEWSRTQMGITIWGLQVWCNRCNKSVIHLDMLGQCACPLPASLPADAEPEPLSQAEIVAMAAVEQLNGRLKAGLRALDEEDDEEDEATNKRRRLDS